MSEPSSGVPKEIVDADVEEQETKEPERVELDVDQDKLDAWGDIKDDYAVDPSGDDSDAGPEADEEVADDAAGHDRQA